jgi:hypothetical protein
MCLCNPLKWSRNMFPEHRRFMNMYVFQVLPNASAEFHLAASSTFLAILEKKLVHPRTFTHTFLQGILSSIDSRDSGTGKSLYVFIYKFLHRFCVPLVSEIWILVLVHRSLSVFAPCKPSVWLYVGLNIFKDCSWHAMCLRVFISKFETKLNVNSTFFWISN